jgi:UrcA family protein
MQRSIMLALTAALAFGFAATAPTAAAARDRATTLNYAALDLNDRAGAEALVRRIENTAERVCGERSGPMPLVQRDAIAQCVREKSIQAVADVNNGGVTALFYHRDPQIVVASR